MKLFTLAAVASVAFASVALAEGHTAKDKAQRMKDTIQSLGNGSEPARSFNGGWGNIAGPANENGKKNVGEKDKDDE